jgi:hypothetical protein
MNMSNVAEKIENNEMKTNNIGDNNMENTIKKAIPLFKEYIKANSKPAKKDKEYGNKLSSYLNQFDFAVYSVIRGKSYKEGLNSEEKAECVAEDMKGKLRFDIERRVQGKEEKVLIAKKGDNYHVAKVLHAVFYELLTKEEIDMLKSYVDEKIPEKKGE